MNSQLIHLPLDLLGTAVTNKVTAELHEVAATGYRAIVMDRGPFFTRGLVVRNADTLEVLEPDVHYKAVQLHIDASLRATQEVCCVLLIEPTTPGARFEVDAQMIGGEYSGTVAALRQMIESLDLDNRTVLWGDLIDVPDYFPPTAHWHDIGDVFGFEYVVAELHQIRRAILMGDQAAFDEIRAYFTRLFETLRDQLGSLTGEIEDHINDRDNPHYVTKEQVGLSNVHNYPVASQTIAAAGESNVHYMTALSTKQAIDALALAPLQTHISDRNNPHEVTKAQVNLGNVENYPIATPQQAAQGQGNAYMTPARVSEAIAAQALVPLNTHADRTDNPHSVNKAQVGLGNVDNFSTANAQQAIQGQANNLFMTPATTRAAVNELLNSALGGHVDRVDNPHQVTKAQVGLGNVDNFATATPQQAAAGTASNLFMTPATTVALLNGIGVIVGTDPALTAHINRSDNPHGTTKTHVGLGSVDNYATAGQPEAESGSANNRFMTPLRTRQAIQAIAVGPLQNQINNRVVIGSNATLNSLTLAGGGYHYGDANGNALVRAGGAYYRFDTNGNFYTLNGRVIAAGGFQPSDKRLKRKIKAVVARPLWRDLSFSKWEMRADGMFGNGYIAQDVLEKCPEFTYEFAPKADNPNKTFIALNNTAMAVEMAHAAGEATDALQKENAELRARLERLEALVEKLTK